jgi:hypothetical protein
MLRVVHNGPSVNALLYSITVRTSSPNKTSLKIRPGPTHILLNWDAAPGKGWLSTYTVKVTLPPQPVQEEDNEVEIKRLEKAINMNKTEEDLEMMKNATKAREITLVTMKPPLNITNLVPESKYLIVLTTSLGREYTSTIKLDEVYTTANNSRDPEEIISVTSLGREFRSAQLSVLTLAIIMVALAIIIFALSGTM